MKKITKIVLFIIVAIIAIGLPIANAEGLLFKQNETVIGGLSSSSVTISRAGIANSALSMQIIGRPASLYIVNVAGTSISIGWIPSNSVASNMLRFKTSTYPINITDGTLGYSGNQNSITLSNLDPGTTYYFSIWGYKNGVYSSSYTTSLITTSAYADLPNFTPPTDTTTIDPDVSAYTGKSWYAIASWMGSAWQFADVGIFLRLFGMIVIALISICIAYGTGNLLVTLLVTVVLLAIGNIFGIVPFWAIVLYGSVSGAIAYVKGNAHA